MLKKLFKGVVASAATLALMGTATAATYDLNIGGASAQYFYWNKAASGFLTTTYGCTATSTEAADKYHGVTRGTGCDVDGVGGNDDTVYVRYHGESSSKGCINAPSCGNYTQVDESTCNWGGPLTYNCTATANAPLHIGAADVDCGSLTQTTQGWEKGFITFSTNPGAFLPYGNAAGYPLPAGMVVETPIVVPFGFIANNTVTHNVCTAPVTNPSGAHKAYDKYWWQCVPDANGYSTDCIGQYKCVDTGSGYECAGGINAGNPCDTPVDCPDVALTDTKCESVPLENLSRLMALHLFSGQITNWNQFGPSFPSLPVVLCMRHGGSGTHATLETAVFRGDAIIKTISTPNFAWHHKSSTDLTDSCVDDFAGAVGYVDADKVLNVDDMGNTHQMKYQGVEPARNKIAYGNYNFWGAQHMFYDPSCVTGVQLTLAQDIISYAGNGLYLTEALFGETAKYWATSSEMQVSKSDDYAYPAR